MIHQDTPSLTGSPRICLTLGVIIPACVKRKQSVRNAYRSKRLPKANFKTSLEKLHVCCTLGHLMKLKLTVGEIAMLEALVNHRRGRGGFQNLLLHVWYRLDAETGELELPVLLLERIH